MPAVRSAVRAHSVSTRACPGWPRPSSWTAATAVRVREVSKRVTGAKACCPVNTPPARAVHRGRTRSGRLPR
ncbi:hypothetical protein ACFQ3Z_04280 [Streptomyces nogalater]